MKIIKDDFQCEAACAGFQTMEELNTALWAWIDVEYNMRNHSSTGEAPAERFVKGVAADQRRVTDLRWFENLFLLRETRTVSKYGNIKLCGNQYHTDARAHGTVVEVRFDPFDLRAVYLFENGKRIETLKVRAIVNEKAPHVPEEKARTPEKVSAESLRYFARLRERHEEAKKLIPTPDYSKLRGNNV